MVGLLYTCHWISNTLYIRKEIINIGLIIYFGISLLKHHLLHLTSYSNFALFEYSYIILEIILPLLLTCKSCNVFGQSESEWVNVAQSCPTLCDSMNYTVHGILQARILEWVALPFSRGSSQSKEESWSSKPRSPMLQADSLPAEPQGKPLSSKGIQSQARNNQQILQLSLSLCVSFRSQIPF